MSSLVPAASEGTETPTSLDDLLPSTAPRDPGQQVESSPEPAARRPADPDREFTPAEIAELDHLHQEVNQASEACERSPFGAKGRKRLRTALRAEDDALSRLGFSSHTEFVYATRSGRTWPPRREEIWGQAEADSEAARQHLTEAKRDLEQLRVESMEELDRIQTRSTTEAEELAAQLSALREEAAHAADENARTHQEAIERGEAELSEARDLEARARAEASDATRSRDAAVDEVARCRVEIDKLRAELGAARADVERMQNESEAVTGPVAEAEAWLDPAHEDSLREAARLDALVQQQEAELADLRAQLEQASTDATANASAEGDVARSREELDVMRAELTAARENTDRLEAELESVHHDLESAHTDTDAARAEVDLVLAEVAALQSVIEGLEAPGGPAGPAGPADAPTDELRRLVELAQQLADDSNAPAPDVPSTPVPVEVSADGSELSQPAELAHARGDAERELADLETRLGRLRSKRRRVKKRLEHERTRFRDERASLEHELAFTAEEASRRQQDARDAEALRDRVRHETQALAARIAAEAASVLDDAVREQRELRLLMQADLDEATAELAALEAGVEMVATDANALRSKLSSIRTSLPRAPIADQAQPEVGGTDLD